jgi:hypothetical protein
MAAVQQAAACMGDHASLCKTNQVHSYARSRLREDNITKCERA